MTNGEKNEKRFDELGLGDSSALEIVHRIAVRKNGDVDLCAITPCSDCIFKFWNCIKEAEEWLTDEAEPDEPTPEKKEEKMEDEIKVGDTVKVTIKDHVRYCEIGTVKTIRHIRIGLNKYEVSFDDNGYGNFFSKNEIEKVKPEKKEEKMEKDEIKVGDTVKVITDHEKEGTTGTVRTIRCARNGTKFYGVRFDGESCGYAFFEHEIEKVKSKKTPPRIVVYRDGDTVTARDLETGETASAVCSKYDIFDFHTGAFIAMARLTHFMDDIRMMRLEAEQIEGDIADMKMRFGALMGEGYKYPEGFFREEEE